MKKNGFSAVESAIKKDEYSDALMDNTFNLVKKSVLNSLIITTFVLVVSLVCYKQISSLAYLIGTTFSNNVVIGPALYFTMIILGFVIGLAYFLGLLYFKKNISKDIKGLKLLYRSYSITDMVLFFFNVVIVVYFFIMFVVTPCSIEGDSMNDTFYDNDRVLVWHVAYSPSIDDVVIFDSVDYGSAQTNRFWIKRIKGLSGTVLSYEDGNLIADGEIIKAISNDQFLTLKQSADIMETDITSFTIPKGKVMIIGDNHVNSKDSCIIGLVDEDDIIGKVFLRFFPFDSFGYPEENDNK